MLTTYEALMAEVEYRRERLSNYAPTGRPHWRPRRRRRGNSSVGQVASPPVAAPQALLSPSPSTPVSRARWIVVRI